MLRLQICNYSAKQMERGILNFFNLVKKLGIDSKMKMGGEIMDNWGALRIYENYSFRKLLGILIKATIHGQLMLM